jgi:monoamine oxidase
MPLEENNEMNKMYVSKSLPLTMANYQILIVGAGMAGLHCAFRLSEKHPNLLIAVAEHYDYVGGRCYTHHQKGGLQWESGAGRIHTSHRLLNHYVDTYKLTKIPLDSKENWVSSKDHRTSSNTWGSTSEIIVTALSKLDKLTLSTNTVEGLLNKVYGKEETAKLLQRFSYRSEVNTMRADLALQSLKGEMGRSGSFYVLKEGFTHLAEAMRKTLESRGVTFLFNHRLSAVEPNTSPIVCKFTKARITADKVILALPSEALKKISPFANLPVLKHLTMRPLLRTYGVFPSPWFQGFHKIVTDSPLRFIIPVNAEKGVIMTSYTDAEDTKPWAKILKDKGENALKHAIMNELRELFPNTNIPQPTAFKAHLWNDGCTYWTPGLYDPVELGDKVLNPLPSSWQNLFVCGESFSQRQAWVEGALEHSDKLIHKFF